MIYFTSDLHLGHQSVINFNHRPFANVEEMNEALITNYNSIVRGEDKVYILGDIAHRLLVEDCNAIIKRLHGKKVLVRGNHDKNYDESLFEKIVDYEMVAFDGGIRVALMHYPILEWNRCHYGTYMFHGHIHSDGAYNEENRAAGIRRYDVGVDAHHYYPVSLPEIVDFFRESFSSQRIGKAPKE